MQEPRLKPGQDGEAGALSLPADTAPLRGAKTERRKLVLTHAPIDDSGRTFGCATRWVEGPANIER